MSSSGAHWAVQPDHSDDESSPATTRLRRVVDRVGPQRAKIVTKGDETNYNYYHYGGYIWNSILEQPTPRVRIAWCFSCSMRVAQPAQGFFTVTVIEAKPSTRTSHGGPSP
ncbi:conserved hypothetical protein [Coccidioides posadasii str. Silveira]|uniref:Uncharacterized protein n=1 Tax=Coccidioides posadasii (strain RMSCC 757 / Silveira) TaxID=443226 RepID=E9DIS1_COCPS|nr:conserved hypothetical protein [Coccidioides posadasii str. Silveira]